MFAQICFLVGALLAGDVTLGNGIRFVDLPARTDSFEIIVGYESEDSTLASVISAFLFTTPSARTMAVAAYGAGGDIEFVSNRDRIAIRVSGPSWAKPVIEREVVKFLSETPEQNPNLVERALVEANFVKVPDFRAKIEGELRAAVIGVAPPSDKISVDANQFIQFFGANYGTDRAFVISTTSLAELEQIPARKSARTTITASRRTPEQRAFRYKPDLPVGAVILASPVPSVYYEGWYATLLLDRLIQRTIPGVSSSVVPSIEPYYYRLEISVPEGQFDDVAEGKFIEDLERLQFTYVQPDLFEAARADAIHYLEQESIQRWFQSLGIEDRRNEGLDRLRAFAPDDMRVTMRDILADHVVASWSPKPKQVTIEVETLDAPKPQTEGAGDRPSLPELSPVAIPVFPIHTHSISDELAPERLSSGVTVVSSSAYAVFVAPRDLRVFDREPGVEDLKNYAAYRPQRILVMAPSEALPRIKEQWLSFKGNPRDTEQVTSIGSVANIDLPALVVLKMLLDRRLLESGLRNEVQLEVEATEGSQIAIRGDAAGRLRVSAWIKEIAREGVSADELAWAREAAIHHLEKMRPDLQSLVWQRDRLGVFSSIPAVTAMHVQDVARIYFE